MASTLSMAEVASALPEGDAAEATPPDADRSSGSTGGITATGGGSGAGVSGSGVVGGYDRAGAPQPAPGDAGREGQGGADVEEEVPPPAASAV